MNKLLFFAPYPSDSNIKDGMISRIKAIDTIFKDVERSYLTVSLKRNIKSNQFIDGNVRVYELNFFLHFFKIIKLIFCSKNIYIHSIHMCRFLYIFFPFIKGVVTLDAHGVVPEEELFYQKKKITSFLMTLVESEVFRYASYVICVTKAMESHFKDKYKKFNGEFIIYNILPSNLFNNSNLEIQTSKNKINVIYSGGISPWQNIGLMLQTIKDNQLNNIEYNILTGDLEGFKKEINKYDIDSNNITILSLHPSELFKFYNKADYAFILRDDVIVNNVANPTKMVEYLYYGIIPIVMSPRIGDYVTLGYEYLSVKDFNETLPKPKQKSKKNIQIANDILNNNNAIDLKKILFSQNII